MNYHTAVHIVTSNQLPTTSMISSFFSSVLFVSATAVHYKQEPLFVSATAVHYKQEPACFGM